MLVLSRRDGETIQIGPDITITIVHSKNGTTKVGVEAPRTVRVTRPNDAATKEQAARYKLDSETYIP